MNDATTSPAGSGDSDDADWFGHAVVPDEPRRPRRRRSRTWLAVIATAVALILTGIVIFGYIGWEYIGTNIVAKRAHQRLDNRLHLQWQYPTVADLLGPGTVASLGSPTAVLRIPALGKSFAVPVIEGVSAADLRKGVGHFPGTGPGQIGNYALAGHRVTNGEPFAGFAKLRPGEHVYVDTAEATYTYVLDTSPSALTVDFRQTWVVAPVPVAPKGEAPPGMPRFSSASPSRAILTLTTCSEIFHTDNRSVAFGHLVKTSAR